MARVFDSEARLVPAWLAAARHLDEGNRRGRNLVLEISRPGVLTTSDLETVGCVDAALVASGSELTIETVAGTIFPHGLYLRRGRPDMYLEYLRLIERAKKRGTWGTYFERMIRRIDRSGDIVNPLEVLVQKLASAVLQKATYASTYELSPSDPAVDLAGADGGELATFEPSVDQNRWYGGPCLSHLSFKLVDRSLVDLTAVYRSHRYCERALGNLLGLVRLQNFVAKESGLGLGTLTCISTHAELDLDAWGGVPKGRELLAALSAK